MREEIGFPHGCPYFSVLVLCYFHFLLLGLKLLVLTPTPTPSLPIPLPGFDFDDAPWTPPPGAKFSPTHIPKICTTLDLIPKSR